MLWRIFKWNLEPSGIHEIFLTNKSWAWWLATPVTVAMPIKVGHCHCGRHPETQNWQVQHARSSTLTFTIRRHKHVWIYLPPTIVTHLTSTWMRSLHFETYHVTNSMIITKRSVYITGFSEPEWQASKEACLWKYFTVRRLEPSDDDTAVTLSHNISGTRHVGGFLQGGYHFEFIAGITRCGPNYKAQHFALTSGR